MADNSIMMKSIYKEIILAKNGFYIPVLVNNKTIESRYNPQNSCKNIIDSIKKDTGFLIVLGLSSGILIQEILKKSDYKILVLERSEEDFSFLQKINTAKEIIQNTSVIKCTLNNLEEILENNYLPAIYGNLQVLDTQPWNEINTDILSEINSRIQKALSNISKDYSVQAHFGKIWTSNIKNNFLISFQTNKNKLSFDISKTAAVIAAGPTLDQTIRKLQDFPDKYVIFSTDTAAQVLIKHSIIPDYIISIDGQHVSYNHFFTKNTKTKYFFDLCANFTSAKHISKTNDIYFYCSGHPLSSLLNIKANNIFPFIYNGSGTVTISALDLAIKTGFTNIEIFGADFSYVNGKSYTNGTYLDSIYSIKSDKTHTLETKFDSLLFRTELQKISQNRMTTTVLESYKESLENYLTRMNSNFYKKEDIYYIHIENRNSKIEFNNYKVDTKAIIKSLQNCEQQEILPALLPYIAYLRKKTNNSLSFEEYCKLAQSFIVSYN